MKYASVCSGIGAPEAAWSPLGWEAVFNSEIEPFPCAVLKHHYPDVPNYGDMTKFKEWPDATFDVLIGGTPCQSFSVAGLRKGLDDPRGNLMLTYLAIADRFRPEWLVWENVPGVLSSGGGRDFGTFLGGLGELGYGFAYRVLDAQYFGVAQRRRRVFVVGHLGDWRRAAAVLFERHSLSGNPPPRREAGKGYTRGVDEGFGSGRSIGIDEEQNAHEEMMGCLKARTAGGGFEGAVYQASPHAPISPAIKARDGKGVSSDGDGDGDGAILVPMVAGFDLAQITSKVNRNRVESGLPQPPLCSGGQPHVAIGIDGSDLGFALRSNPSHSGDKGDGGMNTTMAVAFAQYTRDEVFPLNDMVTRHAGTNGSGKDVGKGHGLGVGGPEDPMFTLTKGDKHSVATAMQVRRLTPRECERLQGFPDGWTDIPFRGKQAADGNRYKSLGNSMAVPVIKWIGERIEMVMALRIA